MHTPILADVVIGPHCPFTDWVFGIVKSLVASQPQARDLRRIDRFDTVTFLQSPRLMLLTNYPSSQIVDAIGRDDLRVIYVVEQPLLVTQYMTDVLNIPIMEAIRSQTASAVANLAIGRGSQTLIVSHDSDRTDDATVRAIAGHLGLACSDEQVATLAASRPAREMDSQAPDSASSGQEVLLEAADQILLPLLAMARGDIVRPVVWPTPVFKFIDRPDELSALTAQPDLDRLGRIPVLEVEIAAVAAGLTLADSGLGDPCPTEHLDDEMHLADLVGELEQRLDPIARRRQMQIGPVVEVARRSGDAGTAEGFLTLIELSFFAQSELR